MECQSSQQTPRFVVQLHRRRYHWTCHVHASALGPLTNECQEEVITKLMTTNKNADATVISSVNIWQVVQLLY
jgi:hypothetical protein